MPVLKNVQPPSSMRRTVALLMILALVLVNGWYALRLRNRGSYLATTLQTVEKGTVQLDTATYDLARLQFSYEQDTGEIRDIFYKMWTADALIVLIGFLLLVRANRIFPERAEDVIA